MNSIEKTRQKNRDSRIEPKKKVGKEEEEEEEEEEEVNK